MRGKNVIIILTNSGKRYLRLLPVLILLTVLLSSIIFANALKRPLKGLSILIDPGYGNIATSSLDSLQSYEKNITLEISGKLQRELDIQKAFTSLSRNSSIATYSPQMSSSSITSHDPEARLAEINSMKYDLFISIHVNSSPALKNTDPFVLYSSKLPESLLLAECLQNTFNSLMINDLGRSTIYIAKASESDYMLSNSKIPGVIVETGSIMNPKDKQMLQNEEYQNKLVNCIIDGLKDYMKELAELKQSDKALHQNEQEPFNLFFDEVKMVSKE